MGVKKEGPVQEYFKDFVSQMTEAFVHKQLDKLTSDIHGRTLYGIDEDSKRLGCIATSLRILPMPRQSNQCAKMEEI